MRCSGLGAASRHIAAQCLRGPCEEQVMTCVNECSYVTHPSVPASSGSLGVRLRESPASQGASILRTNAHVASIDTLGERLRLRDASIP